MADRGKLIYCMNVSLDGFVATEEGGLEWTSVDDEVHQWFNDHHRTLDASLYGRRLYELMAGHWPTAEDDHATTDVMRDYARIWMATPRFVFSTTLTSVEHNSRLVSGDVGEALQAVRREFSGDLEVAGPTLAGQFVQRGLVDEYILAVHPVVLGAGLPFWPPLDAPLRLRQTERSTFASGVELQTYVPA